MNSVFIKRLFTRLFHIFPVDSNKRFFSSYEGKQFSCSPKRVYLALKEKGDSAKIVWEYNRKTPPEEIASGCLLVRHNSIRYLYHLLTAGHIVTNTGISGSIALRQNRQVVINTWHGGGAYKKVGAVIDEAVNGTGTLSMKKAAEQTTWFLSSSQVFTDIMIPSTLIAREKFLGCGMPRNDIFFNERMYRRAASQVRNTYRLGDRKLVLFAPTYRGDSGTSDYTVKKPDNKRLLRALERKFGGKWVTLYRGHYYQSGGGNAPEGIDGTEYEDMQDLLCAADVLITDYSSSIWDFSLTFKPCFLFVPDLSEYESSRGGFYSDINDWPGLVARDDDELEREIMSFDETSYRSRIEHHHNALMSFESGTATDAVLDILKNGRTAKWKNDTTK